VRREIPRESFLVGVVQRNWHSITYYRLRELDSLRRSPIETRHQQHIGHAQPFAEQVWMMTLEARHHRFEIVQEVAFGGFDRSWRRALNLL